jgi:hypothetical protein
MKKALSDSSLVPDDVYHYVLSFNDRDERLLLNIIDPEANDRLHLLNKKSFWKLFAAASKSDYFKAFPNEIESFSRKDVSIVSIFKASIFKAIREKKTSFGKIKEVLNDYELFYSDGAFVHFIKEDISGYRFKGDILDYSHRHDLSERYGKIILDADPSTVSLTDNCLLIIDNYLVKDYTLVSTENRQLCWSQNKSKSAEIYRGSVHKFMKENNLL